MNKTLGALRSALYTLGLWLSLVVYIPVILVATVVPAPRRYRLMRPWNWFSIYWLRITCGVRWKVEGEVPRDGLGGVVMAKHQSTWETFFFPLLFDGPAFVLKRELLRLPIFGWGLAINQPIAIDRKAGRDALRQILEQGSERLKQHRWVIIFPEGTRTAVGEKGKYKPGGALLATQNGARVLPIAHNAGCAWPRGGFIKTPMTITLRIGPLIETAGRKASEINQQVEEWIEAQMATLPCPKQNAEP